VSSEAEINRTIANFFAARQGIGAKPPPGPDAGRAHLLQVGIDQATKRLPIVRAGLADPCAGLEQTAPMLRAARAGA